MAVGMSGQAYVSDTRDNMRVFILLLFDLSVRIYEKYLIKSILYKHLSILDVLLVRLFKSMHLKYLNTFSLPSKFPQYWRGAKIG